MPSVVENTVGWVSVKFESIVSAELVSKPANKSTEILSGSVVVSEVSKQRTLHKHKNSNSGKKLEIKEESSERIARQTEQGSLPA